jgi:hypothetical protein
MWTGAFRVGPANDNELLAIKPFGFAPKAAISWRVWRVGCLGGHALKTKLARVLEDELAVACVMAVELKARLFVSNGARSPLRSMS